MRNHMTFFAVLGALALTPDVTFAQGRGGGKGGPPRGGGGMPGGMKGRSPGGGMPGGMGHGKGGMPGNQGMGKGGQKPGGMGQGKGQGQGGMPGNQGMGKGGQKPGGMGQGKGGGMPENQGMDKSGHGPGGKKPKVGGQSGLGQSESAPTGQTNSQTATTRQGLQIQMAQLLSVQTRLARYQPRSPDESNKIAGKQQAIATQLQAIQQKLNQLSVTP
jgi:hypothetical protein